MRTFKKINESRQAEQQQVPVSEPIQGDEGPQVAASSAMHDMADLQHSDNYGPSLDELASSLNADQIRIFDKIKCQLQHQVQHETGTCNFSDLKPLHMFISGVGGTGKSLLIKAIRALVLDMWHDKEGSLLCAVTAPTGLQHTMSVVSPSTDYCSSLLSKRGKQLATGGWERTH